MANPKTTNKPQNKYSEQFILNDIYEKALGAIGVFGVGWNGQEGQAQTADDLATRIQTSGTDTFVGQAAPGTTEATAKWVAYKIDVNGNVTYADGNGLYDNTATDLTALTYS